MGCCPSTPEELPEQHPPSRSLLAVIPTTRRSHRNWKLDLLKSKVGKTGIYHRIEPDATFPRRWPDIPQLVVNSSSIDLVLETLADFNRTQFLVGGGSGLVPSPASGSGGLGADEVAVNLGLQTEYLATFPLDMCTRPGPLADALTQAAVVDHFMKFGPPTESKFSFKKKKEPEPDPTVDQSLVESAFADALMRGHADLKPQLTEALDAVGFSGTVFNGPKSQEELLAALNAVAPLATAALTACPAVLTSLSRPNEIGSACSMSYRIQGNIKKTEPVAFFIAIALEGVEDPVFADKIVDIWRPPVPDSGVIAEAIELALKRFGDFFYRPQVMEVLKKFSWDEDSDLFKDPAVDYRGLADALIALLPAIDYDLDQKLELKLTGYNYMEDTVLDLASKNAAMQSAAYVKILKDKHNPSYSARFKKLQDKAGSYGAKLTEFSDAVEGSDMMPESVKEFNGELQDGVAALGLEDAERELAWGAKIADQLKSIKEGYGVEVAGSVTVITRDYNTEARQKRHSIIKDAENTSKQAPANYARKIEAAAKALAPKENDDSKESERNLMASNAQNEADDEEEEEEVDDDGLNTLDLGMGQTYVLDKEMRAEFGLADGVAAQTLVSGGAMEKAKIAARMAKAQAAKAARKKAMAAGDAYRAKAEAMADAKKAMADAMAGEKNYCQEWGVTNRKASNADMLASSFVGFYEDATRKTKLDEYIKEVNTATGGRIGWHLDEEWRYFTGNTRFPHGLISPAEIPPLDQSERSRALYVEASGGAVTSCFKRVLRKAEVEGELFANAVAPQKETIKRAASKLKSMVKLMQANEEKERQLVTQHTQVCNDFADKVAAVVDTVAQGCENVDNLKVFLNVAAHGFVDRKASGAVTTAWSQDPTVERLFVERTEKKVKVGKKKKDNPNYNATLGLLRVTLDKSARPMMFSDRPGKEVKAAHALCQDVRKARKDLEDIQKGLDKCNEVRDQLAPNADDDENPTSFSATLGNIKDVYDETTEAMTQWKDVFASESDKIKGSFWDADDLDSEGELKERIDAIVSLPKLPTTEQCDAMETWIGSPFTLPAGLPEGETSSAAEWGTKYLVASIRQGTVVPEDFKTIATDTPEADVPEGGDDEEQDGAEETKGDDGEEAEEGDNEEAGDEEAEGEEEGEEDEEEEEEEDEEEAEEEDEEGDGGEAGAGAEDGEGEDEAGEEEEKNEPDEDDEEDGKKKSKKESKEDIVVEAKQDTQDFYFPVPSGCPEKLALAAAQQYVNMYWLSGRNRKDPVTTSSLLSSSTEKPKQLAPPPRMLGFEPYKYIWMPNYERRLWYAERLELFHPMFKEIKPASVIDAAAEGGEAAALTAIFESLKETRPGGYTCGSCKKKIAPTKIVTVDKKTNKVAKGGASATVSNALQLASGSMPKFEYRIESLCQGYVCHARDFNKECMYNLQRCYVVCMDCGTNKAVSHSKRYRPDVDNVEEMDEAFKMKFDKVSHAKEEGEAEEETKNSAEPAEVTRIEPKGCPPERLDVVAKNRDRDVWTKFGESLDGSSNNYLSTDFGRIGSKPAFMTRYGYTEGQAPWTDVLQGRESGPFAKSMTNWAGGGPRTLKDGAPAIIKKLWEMDPGRLGGLPGKTVKKTETIDPDALKDAVERFFTTDGAPNSWTLSNPDDAESEMVEVQGDGATNAMAKPDKSTLGARCSGPQMRFFATQVCSFFYSRTKCRNQWHIDAFRYESDPTKRDPLCQEEAPQFCRDTVNIMYPSHIDEVQMNIVGIEDMDYLFRECCEPLEIMSSAITTAEQAKIDALVACNFSEEGELMNGSCSTMTDAMSKLKSALKLRAEQPKENAWDTKDMKRPPVWAPPRMVSMKADDAKQTAFVGLKFLKFHLAGDFSDEDKKPKGAKTGDLIHAENKDLLTACEAIELFWKSNMKLYKGLAMQMKYLTFLSGCAKTDTARFAKMLTTNFGPLSSEGFEKAKAALTENVDSIKRQLQALKDSLETCSRDIVGVRSELTTWRKEWKKECVTPAPKIIYDVKKREESMIPFVIGITNADISADEQAKCVDEIVGVVGQFYKPKELTKKSNGNQLAKFVNLMAMFCKEALDLDEDEKEVIDAYYPNPLLELLDFDDAVMDEVNECFLEVSMSVLEAVKKIDELDMITFKLFDQCSFDGQHDKPSTMKEALKRVADNAKTYDKRARMFYVRAEDGTYELAALWKPEAGLKAIAKSWFGMELAKPIVLPQSLQDVATEIERVLGQQHTLKDALDLIEQRIIRAQNKVYEEYIWTENIGGDSPMTTQMKTDNYDSKTIKAAVKAARKNNAKVASIVKHIQTTKKREKNWKADESAAALKQYKFLYGCETIREYLRSVEAPTQKGKICDYLAGQLVPGLPADADKDKKRMNKVRQEEVAKDLKDYVVQVALQETNTKLATDKKKRAAQEAKILDHAFAYVTYAADKDASYPNLQQEAIKAALKAADKVKRGGQKLAAISEALAEENEVDLGHVRPLEEERRAFMRDLINYASTKHPTLKIQPKTESKANKDIGEKKTGEISKEERLAEGVEAVDQLEEQVWGQFESNFGVTGVDEFPEVVLSGIPECDFMLSTVPEQFSKITKAMNKIRNARATFIAKAADLESSEADKPKTVPAGIATMIKVFTEYAMTVRDKIENASQLIGFKVGFEIECDQNIEEDMGEVVNDPSKLSALVEKIMSNIVDMEDVKKQFKSQTLPPPPPDLGPAVMALGAYAQALDPSLSVGGSGSGSSQASYICSQATSEIREVQESLHKSLKDDKFLDHTLSVMPFEMLDDPKFKPPSLNILNPFPNIKKPGLMKLDTANLLQGAPTCFSKYLDVSLKNPNAAKLMKPFIDALKDNKPNFPSPNFPGGFRLPKITEVLGTDMLQELSMIGTQVLGDVVTQLFMVSNPVTAIMKSIKDAYKGAKKMYMVANQARKQLRKMALAGAANAVKELQRRRIKASMGKTIRELKQFVKSAKAFPIELKKDVEELATVTNQVRSTWTTADAQHKAFDAAKGKIAKSVALSKVVEEVKEEAKKEESKVEHKELSVRTDQKIKGPRYSMKKPDSDEYHAHLNEEEYNALADIYKYEYFKFEKPGAAPIPVGPELKAKHEAEVKLTNELLEKARAEKTKFDEGVKSGMSVEKLDEIVRKIKDTLEGVPGKYRSKGKPIMDEFKKIQITIVCHFPAGCDKLFHEAQRVSKGRH